MSISNVRHFFYNLVTSYGNTLVSSILSFVSVPIAIRYWGSNVYGIWTIIISFAVYLSVSGLGVDAATGLLITKNNNGKVKDSILKKGVLVSIIGSLVFLTVFYLTILLIPNWIHVLGKLSYDEYNLARKCMIIFVTVFVLCLPFSTITNSFAGYDKAYLINLFGLISSLVNFFILLFTVYYRLSLIKYTILYCSVILCINVIKLAVFYHVKHSFDRNHHGTTNMQLFEDTNDESRYRTIIRMGLQIALYGIAGLMVTNISNLIISNNISMASVVPYSLVSRLFQILFGFLFIINNAIVPLLGKEFSNGNWDWIKTVYSQVFVISICIMGFFILGLNLFIYDFITLWVGKDVVPSILLVVLFSLYYVNVSLSNVNLIFINSLNYTKGVALSIWCDTVVFILLSLYFVKGLHISGVVLGLFLGSMSCSCWRLPRIVFLRSEGRLKYDFPFLIKALLIIFVCCGLSCFCIVFIHNRMIRYFISLVILLLYVIIVYFFIPVKIKTFTRRFVTMKLKKHE